MKKMIPVLLALCLLIAPMTAKVSADDHSYSASIPTVDQTTNPDVAFLAGTVPADSEWTDGILLPIHALVLSMTEHEPVYDPQSAPFVWNALYYALSMYGQMDDRAQLTDDALLLPSESINDFSRALFADLDALPALPPELDGFITYDSTCDSYRLALGDFALTRTELGHPAAQPDGSYTVEGTLLSPEDESPLCSFRVTLLENDTMFGFSIADVSLF